MDPVEATRTVKHLAREAGFQRVGIAAIDSLPSAALDRLREWVGAGRYGELGYMSRQLDVRTDPTKLLDSARSVICLAVSYAHPPDGTPTAARVARYAHSRDYHKTLKQRCHTLMDRLRDEMPSFQGRALVDTAPLMERTFAAMAGLGWIGQNGCLHVPGLGSWVLLAEVVTTLPLEPDQPIETLCRQCGACLRACPTGALSPDGTLDADLCISYLNKDAAEIPPARWESMGTWIFGCDRCQEACALNRDVACGDEAFLGDGRAIRELTIAQVLSWTPDRFERVTAGTPVYRAGYRRVLRNAVIAAGNTDDPSLAEAVRAVGQREPDMQPYVRWALERLTGGQAV
jgi:epoxyqueuosine reductase